MRPHQHKRTFIITTLPMLVIGGVFVLLSSAAPLSAQTCGAVKGFWQFEQNLNDSSGCGNHGSNSQPLYPIQYDPNGAYGFGVSRNGFESPIPLANLNNSLMLTDSISIEAWVKLSSFAIGFHHIIDNLGVYALSVKDGRIAAMLHGPYSWWVPTSIPVLSLNEWHYLVATYDGSSEKLYVDGLLVVSQAGSGGIPAGTGQIAIGGIGNVFENNYLFIGSLDNVRVTNRALTSQEVAANYTRSKIYLPLISKVVPPPWTNSYYMQTVSSTVAYNMGYAFGQQINQIPGTQDSVVVLAFGKPTYEGGQAGAGLFGYGPVYTSTIAIVAEQFARGYYLGAGSDTSSQLMLAVGTSNCGHLPDCNNDRVTYTHGREWGQMVNDVASWIANNGYASQVKIAGASDMELNWNGPYSTTQWVNGYLSATNWRIYDFGDAAGCPPAGNCNGGRFTPDWSPYDVWYISWGGAELQKGVQYRGQITSLPLIYGETHAKQWASLSLYGYTSQAGRVTIAGTMTQYQRCQQIQCDPTTDNSPEEGWSQLWVELNNNPYTAQSLPWSTDIIYKQP